MSMDLNGQWALLNSMPKGGVWFYRMYRREQRGKDRDYESWSAASTVNPYLDAIAIDLERARLAAGSGARATASLLALAPGDRGALRRTDAGRLVGPRP